MRAVDFHATVLTGHKEMAVEVPFDPSATWGIAPQPLRTGRRGHRVAATIGKLEFQTVIVPRSKRFYLVLTSDVCRDARISAGDAINVTVQPEERNTVA